MGITVAVNSAAHENHELLYHRVPELLRREQKLAFLAECVASRKSVLGAVEWRRLQPDAQLTWLRAEHADEYARFIPLGTKKAKAAKGDSALAVETIFKSFSNGVKTNRDLVVYDFDHRQLAERVEAFVEDYNAEVDRYRRHGNPDNIDSFVRYERVKWSRNLKRELNRGYLCCLFSRQYPHKYVQTF